MTIPHASAALDTQRFMDVPFNNNGSGRFKEALMNKGEGKEGTAYRNHE